MNKTKRFSNIWLIALAVSITGLLTLCTPHKITPSYNSSKKITSKKTSSTNYQNQSKKNNNNSNSSNSLNSISNKLGITVTSSDNKKLYSEAASWIGTKYKYGGTSRNGVDCSGFTHLMYKNVYGKTISRQSSSILTNDCKRINKNQLKEGDLVFFRTDGKKSSVPNHVGIYLKQNKFIHASSSKGVVISDLTTKYYIQNWITGGRVK